ncbi:tetratricopeptide repeat protein [Alteromonas sp. 5E99-2]|uniref:tetratricopeptide repeat protein n=1 Tax=Alteromonas sp. 5E99-2 TaxID=2817683 RepID=UPI001A99293C|nr:tetratricopeptide repeat protein [Alteromonas sp. 5E99-2]MBO1256346.1 tetratricopeptide repeat protein [Alteromonas sp. 5E99-2]
MKKKLFSPFFILFLWLYSLFSLAQSTSIIECELASTAEKEGKLDEALIRLKNCLSTNPEYAPGLLLRANIFAQKKQFSAALNMYQSLIDNNVDYALFSDTWGQVLWQQEQFNTIIQFSEFNTLPAKQQVNWLLLRSKACIATNDVPCAEESVQLIEKTSKNQFDLMLGIAQIKIHEKNYVEARESLNEALALSPDNPSVNYLYGRLALDEKNAKEAISIFLKLLENDPTNVLVLRGLTDAYLMDELQVEAAEVIENILALQPGDPFALTTREIVLSELDEIRAPDPSFERMRNKVAELPNGAVQSNSQLLYLRGLLAFIAKQYESALRDFNLLYKQDKTDLQSVIFLAKTRFSLGKNKEAIQLLENHQDSLLDTPDILLLLTEQYMERNQTFKASPLIEKLTTQYPNSPNVLLIQVKYLVYQGQIDDALVLLETLVDQYPKSVDVNRIATIYAIQIQNYTLAEKSLSALKNIRPSYTVKELSAVLALKQGNVKTAKSLFSELQKIAPNSTTINYNLALIDLAQKNNDDGIAKLKKIIKAQPGHAPSLYMLGLVELDQHHTQEGRSLLQKAAFASKNAPYILKSLISLENRQGKFNASLDYANKLVEVSPFNIDNLIIRADIYRKMEDVSSVKIEIQRILAMQPLTIQHYELLSNLYLQINHVDEAAELLLIGAELFNEASFTVRAAEILLNANDTDKVDTIFAKMTKAEKAHPKVVFLLARRAEQNGNVDNAKALYTQLAKTDPYSNVLMGKLYQYSTDKQIKSIMLDALQRRLSENNNDYFAHNLLAQIYFYDGELVKARNEYETLLEFDQQENRAGILNRLSIIADGLNDPESTLRFAQEAYDLNNNNPAIMTQFGWSLVRFDDAKEGLKILRQASSLDNSNELTRYYTAETLYKLALYKESYAEIQTISETDNESIRALSLKLEEKLENLN